MKGESIKKLSLRILSIVMLILTSFLFIVTVIFVNQRMNYRERNVADDGHLLLSDQSVYREPVYLNGQWESFEGVVCTSPQEVKNLGDASAYVTFPVASIAQAKKKATYRIRFTLPQGERDKLVIYIPNFYKSGTVYLNGVKLEYLQEGKPWLGASTLESVLRMSSIVPGSSWQELVITGDFEKQSTTLYQRPIVMGTFQNIGSLAVFLSSNEMFIMGLLILILINGYVFMLFRPGHQVISTMTLFDSAILMRILLSMSFVLSFAKSIFPWLPVSDDVSVSATLFFLMVGGLVGCKLSEALYDPEKKVPQWLIKPLPWIYGVFAIIFPLNPVFFESTGKYILIVVYFITFVGVFLQYRISWANKERRSYYFLQFIKTIYIGTLILIDILLWGKSTDLLILFYLYSSFFIFHVVVRLYDSNESYLRVEVLNAGLEDIVKQRTKELSEANNVLSELSIKDALTQIFNRLHFERAMEAAEAEFEEGTPLHLCIFDLDLFKKINDTYGHNVGDEQLKTMARLVDDAIDENVIFARIGGEEFVLLFKGLSRERVLACVKKVHGIIAEDAIVNPKHTTASFGVSCFCPGETSKILLKKADVALYEAKRLGRNCIVINFDEKLLRLKKED